jgi:hypothetical protein
MEAEVKLKIVASSAISLKAESIIHAVYDIEPQVGPVIIAGTLI